MSPGARTSTQPPAIPTPDQVHALADAFSVKPEPGKPSRERYRALVYLAAGAGLPRAKLGAWSWSTFLPREIRIVQQVVTPPGKLPRLAHKKTATSRRTVEMGQVVDDALARHIDIFPPVDVEILDEMNQRKLVTRRAKLPITSGRGNPIQRTGWAYPWKKAVEAVDGVPEGFGYHVMADETPVLVHNEPRPRPADFIDGPMPQRGQTALYVIWRPGTGEFLKWGIWTNNGESRYSATSMLNRGERMQIVRSYDTKADALAAERFATSRSPGPDNLKEQLDGKGTWQSWQQTMAELKASTCW